MTRRSLMSFAVAISLLFAGTASAGPVVFTDRIAWQAAIGGGGNLFENFNSFATDAVYSASVPVTAGFLTLQVDASTSDTSWRIDASPFAFGTVPAVNGSSFAVTLFNGLYGGTQLAFGPVMAFGFDYAGSSYSDGSGTLTTSRGDIVVLGSSAVTARSFLGLVYTGGETFTSVTWGGTNNTFAAGIDNVEALGVTAVPEPATLVLVGLGFGLAFTRLRRTVVAGRTAA